jgi:hypothetical protein
MWRMSTPICCGPRRRTARRRKRSSHGRSRRNRVLTLSVAVPD